MADFHGCAAGRWTREQPGFLKGIDNVNKFFDS